MKYPIVSPNVYIIPCNFAQEIDVSLNGLLTLPGYVITTNAILVCNVRDDIGFVFAFGPNVSMLRVKASGEFCWYTTGNFNSIILSLYGDGVNAPVISAVNFIGDSLIEVSSNIASAFYTSILQIPPENVFNNGGIVQMPVISFNVPLGPCNTGLNSSATYFDAKNGLMLCEYVQPFPLTYNLWAGVYAINGSTINTINAGFCGNFPSGTDPIIQSSNLNNIVGGVQYKPNNIGFAYNQRGQFIGRGVEFNDMLGNFCAFCDNTIMPGNLQCAVVTKDYPSMNLLLKQVLDQSSNIFNNTAFKNHPANVSASAADLNCAALSSYYAECYLYDGVKFVALSGLHTTATWGSIAGFVGNVAINLYPKFISGALYKPTISLNAPTVQIPIMEPPPVINAPLATSLLNWHRPISTRGLFKT